MKIRSPHISFETLADLAENQIPAEKRTKSLAHLSTCSSCTDELKRLEHVVLLMRTDREADAPRDLTSYAMNLFGKGREASRPSRVRRLIAALTFDSSTDFAPAFGVRSAQATSRQLVYSFEGNDVDLRVIAKQDKWVVAGQVLGQDCVGGEVELEGEAGSAAAPLSELCEFTLPPVVAGNYKLLLRFAKIEVEVSQLKVGE